MTPPSPLRFRTPFEKRADGATSPSRNPRRGGKDHEPATISALLAAIAHGELLLVGVLLGRGVDHRLDHLVVRRVPVADDVPLGAVPLLDTALTGTLVVGAADFEWPQ